MLNELYNCPPYFVIILLDSFILIDLQYKVSKFFLALITTYLLKIALRCLQVIFYLCILSWVTEKRSIICFLHLKDMCRVLFIAARPTFFSNSTTSCIDSRNSCIRLHFFLFFIFSFNIFLSRQNFQISWDIDIFSKAIFYKVCMELRLIIRLFT